MNTALLSDLQSDLQSETIAESQTESRLAHEFPRVPMRVIIGVLAAYRRITPSLNDAERAARRRLLDACTV